MWGRPLIIFSGLHFPFLLIAPKLFERYFMVLLPGTLALAGAMSLRSRWQLRLPALAILGILAVILAHDQFLAKNAALWQLGRRALARGIPARDIDGGFQWNGWHSTHGIERGRDESPPRGLTQRSTGRFPSVTGRYKLVSSPPPGAHVIDSASYQLWLTPGERRLFLVEAGQVTQTR